MDGVRGVGHESIPGRVRRLVLEGRTEEVSDAELVSLLVGTDGARSLTGLALTGPIYSAIGAADTVALTACDGIGRAGAARLLAGLEMGRRAVCARADERPTVSTPEDVVDVCAPRLLGKDREHFLALALNTKNRLLRIFEVSVGSLNASIVHPRELFKTAVQASAASIVVVHNHPSGDPTPSGADIQLTRRLVKAGDILGIEVLDHVVVGEGGSHASLRDMGVM